MTVLGPSCAKSVRSQGGGVGEPRTGIIYMGCVTSVYSPTGPPEAGRDRRCSTGAKAGLFFGGLQLGFHRCMGVAVRGAAWEHGDPNAECIGRFYRGFVRRRRWWFHRGRNAVGVGGGSRYGPMRTGVPPVRVAIRGAVPPLRREQEAPPVDTGCYRWGRGTGCMVGVAIQRCGSRCPGAVREVHRGGSLP